MIHNKSKKLYLTDPLNINLENHSNKVNRVLVGGVFKSNYKSYEKLENSTITFICFNIESFVEKKNIATSKFTYTGNLIFSYNLESKILYIKELPKYGPNHISIFTSDILKIILDKIEKHDDKKNIHIIFANQYEKFSIDNNLPRLYPQIADDLSYQRMINIFKEMESEEEKIKADVLSKKRLKDQEDKKTARIIAKKSIIHGIDERDYKDYETYLKALNNRLYEVCEYKIKNIKRHLEANKKQYIDLLKKNAKNNLSLIKVLEYLRNYLNNYDNNDELSFKVRSYFESSIPEQLSEDLLELYYSLVFEFDTNCHNSNSLISLLSKEREKRYWEDIRFIDQHTRVRGASREMYDYMLGIHDFSPSGVAEIVNYNNPILKRKRIVQKDFKKAVDLLFQITKLKEQLAKYEEMLKNPDKTFINFNKQNDAWNSINSFPYWLRLGRDTFPSENKERFNLLMIKPGTSDIDFDSLRIFTCNNGKEFGATKVERAHNLNELMHNVKKIHETSRLIITIPASLKFDNIIKLIDYSQKYSSEVLFICETPDIAVTLKSILFDRAVKAFNSTYVDKYNTIKRNRYLNRCFVAVDPKYYANFMVDTPNNKNFYHRYDYTGNYKYRKKEPASLDYMMNYCLYLNTYRGILNQEHCSNQFLGSYNSKEEEIPLPAVSLIDLANGCYRQLKEFEDMDDDEIKRYVNFHYPNRFYLDHSYINNLYSIKTESEYDEIEKSEKEFLKKKETKKQNFQESIELFDGVSETYEPSSFSKEKVKTYALKPDEDIYYDNDEDIPFN